LELLTSAGAQELHPGNDRAAALLPGRLYFARADKLETI
jgi:hypothetical protein